MTEIPLDCPFINQSLHFSAYIVRTDFLYDPEDENQAVHLIHHYVYEHPNALIARDHAVAKAIDIKKRMELGSDDPNFKYDLTGLELYLEFRLEMCSGDQDGITLRHWILDSEPVTDEGLEKNLAIERCLLKRMGFELMGDDLLLGIVQMLPNKAL